MVSVSLLQRLERDGAGAERADFTDDSAILDSILANLQLILNSRKGCCETRPDFGLSDFNATADYRSSFLSIARDVERQMRAFEPRLRNVSVQPVEDKTRPLEFIFHVSGELAHDDRTIRVSFDSVLNSDGRMRFSG
ncbi:type VI secretion system baseplate subunit TssE [Agrobacterium sp. a22-2]|uniref:type VI secretion system baseplate subunit TssE n=1 Tax=Agrobacterium sp. a22-2 TaxID=2283840 RepID=UPI001445CF2A|nr:type VI secretion system baseplate subunit TssE [Agrobacterium sp. a22-2]NKN36392.1 type VI secretion system baseplate subunit TssE [Agrobacterium sp. a22-2]